jgi:hypothetical protein
MTLLNKIEHMFIPVEFAEIVSTAITIVIIRTGRLESTHPVGSRVDS